MNPQVNPLVSVVIVNYNGAQVLMPCLESVYAQSYRPVEVIVVDNASSDGSIDVVREKFSDVHLVVCGENLGFAEGNNRGVAIARGELVVLLNDDALVTDGWIQGLLEMLQRPGVAVVTSRVVTEGVPPSWYQMNGTLNFLGYNIMRVFGDLSMVFFAGGASLMFRKAECAEPFPKEYFLYHEDVYLSWRMRLQGRSVAMAQNSLVHHRGSVTTRRYVPTLVTFYQERNRVLNCLLMYEARTLVRLIPYFLLDAVVKLAMSVAAGRKSPLGILHAYWWIVTHTAWIRSERRKLQQARNVGDKEIMKLMSASIVEGESTPASVVNGVSRLYARIVGLSFHG
jgi:GT2 family glycosyltransferase